VVFSTLPCDDLLDAGKFLAVDYRVSCLDTKDTSYRSYDHVDIVIWPVGFPLLCCALFWYYEVPQIAALKIKRAEERAFLQHWTTELARLNKSPIGINCLELQELNQMQLYQLLKSITSSSSPSDANAGLELGIGSREIFDALQSCAEPGSSDAPPQSLGCSQLSTGYLAEQADSPSLQETGMQVRTILAIHTDMIDQVLGCSQSTKQATTRFQTTCPAKTN
jgi:hypothetical protein